MAGFKRKTSSSKSKLMKGPLSVKEVSKRGVGTGSYDDRVLHRVLKNLSKLKRQRKNTLSKFYCQSESLKEKCVDPEVGLRCRQLPAVVQQLRKAILMQHWDEVATLLIILCHPGLKLYTSIIVKGCFVVLFNHSNSSTSLVQNFIRHATEYVLEEDVNKYMKILFTLRKSALAPLIRGKFIRKTGDYKVIRDPEFEKL